MKHLFKACALAFLAVLAGLPAQASDEIHYIGFNRFVTDHEAESSVAFDDYMRKLLPIMSRYGMTAESYDVLHGGSENLGADVVTFGTARDETSFQEFFQDSDFQQIFPMLVGALSDHQVIFTSGPFSADEERNGHTLLSLNWISGDPRSGIDEIEELNSAMTPIFGTYGVRQVARTAGIMSNRGLAGEITPTTPPHLVELWSIEDAHGFFDDPLVRSSAETAEKLVSRSESFWLRPRDIR